MKKLSLLLALVSLDTFAQTSIYEQVQSLLNKSNDQLIIEEIPTLENKTKKYLTIDKKSDNSTEQKIGLVQKIIDYGPLFGSKTFNQIITGVLLAKERIIKQRSLISV